MIRKAMMCVVAAAIAWGAVAAVAEDGKKTAEDQVGQAIKFMRDVDLKAIYKLPPKQREAEAIKLDEAWQTLLDNGKTSIEKLKEEFKRMEAAKEKNDFFALGASVLIWEIAKADEAELIAKLWQGADLSVNYNYVFSTAMQAAVTRDPKVLPILKAVLADRKGTFPVPQHAMRLRWPETIEFIWGVYGYDGLAELHKVLKTSQDPAELVSAMTLLTGSYYLPALEDIRKLTQSKDQAVRDCAYEQLGRYSHPDDRKRLVEAAKNGNRAAFEGLVVASDPAAMDVIDKYLDSKDEKTQDLVLHACYAVPCRKGLDLVLAWSADPKKSGHDARKLEFVRDGIFGAIQSSAEAYQKLDDAGKDKLFAKLPARRVLSYDPVAKKISHDQFVEAVKYWQSKKRIEHEKYKDVTEEQAFAVATPDDIKMLVDLKARIHERLSDESLYEIRDINKLIWNILQRKFQQERQKGSVGL